MDVPYFANNLYAYMYGPQQNLGFFNKLLSFKQIHKTVFFLSCKRGVIRLKNTDFFLFDNCPSWHKISKTLII